MSATEVQLEYDLILGESHDAVLFQIAGREVSIPRRDIVRYDEEGRLWVSPQTAKHLELRE